MTPRPQLLGCEQLEAREVPAVVYGLAAGNVLFRFDSANPSAATTVGTVTGLGANQTLVGIDFRPRTGQLIGSAVTTASANNSVIFTYTINPTTAVATFVGQTAAALPGAGDVPTGYDFNPTVDRIRVVNTNDENARLNPNNGALAGDDTDLTPAATTDIIAAAYDRNFDRQALMMPSNNVIPTTLYLIDRSTSTLALQGGANGTPSPNGGVVTDFLTGLGFTLSATNDGGFDIAVDPTVSFALNNNGLGRALAALTASDNVTRLYDINLATGAATVIGVLGNGTQNVRSIAIVPAAAVAVGSGLGANGDGRLLNATNGAIRQAVKPFQGFSGGIRAASGDVNGDGYADLIVSAIAPQGHVKVFSGLNGQQLPGLIGSFFAFQGFFGTVNVGSGDVNADGFDDVLVSAIATNGHVKAFSGRDGSLLSSFFAYPGFSGSVAVSAADFDRNGIAEIITVASFNGHVKVFDATGAPFTSVSLPGFVNSFLAFEGFPGEAYVTGGDLNHDGFADIAVSSGRGTRGHIRVFSSTNNAVLASFFAFGPGFNGGAFVGTADGNSDGFLDLVVTPGPGRLAEVFRFDFTTGALAPFPAFPGYFGGATVGGARG